MPAAMLALSVQRPIALTKFNGLLNHQVSRADTEVSERSGSTDSGYDTTVLDWRAPPGTLQPADASFNAATATQPTTGRDRTLPPLELSNWPEGQQIPEQAGYSPHPLTAEAANPAADFPDTRPVKSSVTFQIAPLNNDGAGCRRKHTERRHFGIHG